MSQTQAIVETLDIPLDQIKPSPYQPRLTFNLEDIQGSIQRDGILVPLTVRKREGYYELVDGERRVRLAKELGYESVPCTVIDVDDDTARRMVWKVNTLRQEYTPKEKACYFKTLQEEYGMSLRGIARECDYSEDLVVAHLNVLKLPKKYKNLVWEGPLSVSHIQELRPIFNGAQSLAPIIQKLDLVLERKLTSKELRQTIRPELEEIERKRVESAKKAVGEIETEVKEPETPEELEEAARVLRREAKRRKTPRQIREEKRRKARKTLDNIARRIADTRSLISVDEYERRIKALETVIEEEPDQAISELKALNRQLQADVKKAKEEEMKRRIEEEAKRRAKELEEAEKRRIEEEARKKAHEEILSSPQLLQEVTERVRETTAQELLAMDERARQAVEEIAGPLKEALIKADMDIKSIKNSEGRRLLENYMIIGSILSTLENNRIFCLKHKNEKPALMWKCDIPLSETHNQLKKKLGMG